MLLRCSLVIDTLVSVGLPALCVSMPLSAGAQSSTIAAPPVSAPPVSVPAVLGASSPQVVVLAVPIQRVTVDGARAVPVTDILKAAAAQTVGRVGSPEVVHLATQAVIALYHARGYPVAEVTGVDITPDGTLHIMVAEGTIRRIIVLGNRKTRAATILGTLSLRPGDTYDDSRVRIDRNRLARLGIFEDVIISAEVPGSEQTTPPLSSTKAKGVDISLTPDRSDGATPTAGGTKDDAGAPVSPGGAAGPTAPASPIAPAGSGTPSSPTNPPVPLTPPATPGDASAPALPDASTPPQVPPGPGVPTGTATSVVIPPPVPAPLPVLAELPVEQDEIGQVDLVVRVKEHKTFNIAATVGYADAIGPVGFIDLREVNAFGTAQRFGIQWQRVSNSYYNPDGSVQRGDSRHAMDFSYEKPTLGARALTYSLNVYDKNTIFLPYFSGQDETIREFEKRKGVMASVGRNISRTLTAHVLLRREDVGYDRLSNGYSGPLPPVGLYLDSAARVGALGAELVSDGRDAADNPRSGHLNSVRYERASNFLGGNRAYGQTTVDLRGYSPLTHGKTGPVLALRALGGYSTGDLPLPEYYFIGGYDLLRGYDLYSIYGNRMLLGTAEIRTPLSPGVQGVVFVDDGAAWLPGASTSLRSLKSGAGLGLRFLSPIGPIRFDAAYGSSLKTYVTLGQSF